MRSSLCFTLCGLHILCNVPILIIHPHSGKYDVGGGNHGCIRWNVISWRYFYAVTKLIFIHPTTNFYATSAPKTFLRILSIDFMHPISHHVPWLKFQIYEFYFFFQKNIHNGSWIVHKNIRSSLVKTIFESDASLRNYNEKTKEIILDVCMLACVSSVRLCQVEHLAREEVSMW